MFLIYRKFLYDQDIIWWVHIFGWNNIFVSARLRFCHNVSQFSFITSLQRTSLAAFRFIIYIMSAKISYLALIDIMHAPHAIQRFPWLIYLIIFATGTPPLIFCFQYQTERVFLLALIMSFQQSYKMVPNKIVYWHPIYVNVRNSFEMAIM